MRADTFQVRRYLFRDQALSMVDAGETTLIELLEPLEVLEVVEVFKLWELSELLDLWGLSQVLEIFT